MAEQMKHTAMKQLASWQLLLLVLLMLRMLVLGMNGKGVLAVRRGGRRVQWALQRGKGQHKVQGRS